CDVRGDVVCGGCSVPMRRKQTDGIILVLSEDFMSVYAANNILRGIKNLNGSECILGLVLNSRSPEDRIRVEQFSKATEIPILGIIEKNSVFSDAEGAGKTVAELYPESDSAKQLQAVADKVLEVIDGKGARYRAKPLNENAMTEIAAKQEVTDFSPPKVRVKCHFDNVDRDRGMVYKGDQAMPACTSHGAVELLLSIKDAAIVLHGPKNCAFLMEYAWMRRSTLMHNGRGCSLPDNIYSTGMNASNVFTGDRECLRSTIEKALADGFRTVFVVLTCTPDTIGTDVQSVISEIDAKDANIVAVDPDEYFLSGRFGGYRGGLKALSKIVDWSKPIVKGRVGLLSFEPNFLADKANLKVVEEILGAFGLTLGPIFTDNISLKEIEELSTCEHFIQLGWGPFSKMIVEYMLPEGRKAHMFEPPSLLTGIIEWCTKLGEITGQPDKAEEFVSRKTREFEELESHLKGKYNGKRVAFYVHKDMYLDPYLDALEFMGFEIVTRIGWKELFERPPRPPSRGGELPMIGDIELCHLADVLDENRIDLVISGDPRTGRIGRPWTGMGSRFLGLDGYADWVEKVDNCMNMRPYQKWKEVKL
ncbi:MAG: hypothetical protein MJZ21_04935, partial [archaeon]|nr:hypothetical protein [archaeon]